MYSPGVKVTLSELHRETAKVVHPVIHAGEEVTITDNGQPCAKIVPVKKPVDRKAALALLRTMGPIELPPRK